jgi:hypothetical protein
VQASPSTTVKPKDAGSARTSRISPAMSNSATCGPVGRASSSASSKTRERSVSTASPPSSRSSEMPVTPRSIMSSTTTRVAPASRMSCTRSASAWATPTTSRVTRSSSSGGDVVAPRPYGHELVGVEGAVLVEEDLELPGHRAGRGAVVLVDRSHVGAALGVVQAADRGLRTVVGDQPVRLLGVVVLLREQLTPRASLRRPEDEAAGARVAPAVAERHHPADGGVGCRRSRRASGQCQRGERGDDGEPHGAVTDTHQGVSSPPADSRQRH